MSEQEFLESGILEQYVMDLLSPADKLQAEEYIGLHPKVGKAYAELQEAIRTMADDHGIPPPPHMKADILQEIDKELDVAKVQKNRYFWMLPAALALGMVFTTLSYMKVHELKDELQHKEDVYAKALADCQQTENDNNNYAQQLFFYSHHATRSIELEAQENAGFKAVAFYNKQAKQMSIEVLDKASLPASKCLYLWGDVHGEMVKIGRLDQVRKDELISMDAEMESFNITIEDADEEVAAPTVSELIASVSI